MRGTFANIRLRNLLAPDTEGGFTTKDGEVKPIYDAAIEYHEEGTPLCVIAGKEYGSGSSRDWAAKGPRLLGVRFVLAESYERIHRSNLVGMGILPLQFPDGEIGGVARARRGRRRSTSSRSRRARRRLRSPRPGVRTSRRASASTRRTSGSTTGTTASCTSCCATCARTDPSRTAGGPGCRRTPPGRSRARSSTSSATTRTRPTPTAGTRGQQLGNPAYMKALQAEHNEAWLSQLAQQAATPTRLAITPGNVFPGWNGGNPLRRGWSGTRGLRVPVGLHEPLRRADPRRRLRAAAGRARPVHAQAAAPAVPGRGDHDRVDPGLGADVLVARRGPRRARLRGAHLRRAGAGHARRRSRTRTTR